MRSMLSVCAALAVIAGSAASAWAQEGSAQPAAAQPAEKAPDAAAAAAQPATPPAPAGIPVPTGEVVNKTELEGGLLLEDLKIGDGKEVKPNAAVVAYYHGTLKSDGTVFDSAFERGQPAAFPLNQVIQGWQKGVPGMKIGGIRRLTIPAALGYGANSPSAKIPANSDLVFIIQLVDAVHYEDIKVGEGDASAAVQCVAVAAHTITDESGKVVDKAEAAAPYIWFPGEITGLGFGLEGMKKGGKRKIHIPKEFNPPVPGLESTRPSNVPLTVEIELLAFRNLPGR